MYPRCNFSYMSMMAQRIKNLILKITIVTGDILMMVLLCSKSLVKLLSNQ